MLNKQTSLHREYDKNLSVFVTAISITQGKIVSNIFKSNQLICICSGKYNKNLQQHIPKDCVFNLTNIPLKMEIISHCY